MVVVEEVVVTDEAEVVVVVLLPVEAIVGEEAVVVAVDLAAGAPTSGFFGSVLSAAEDFIVPGVAGFSSFTAGTGLLA